MAVASSSISLDINPIEIATLQSETPRLIEGTLSFPSCTIKELKLNYSSAEVPQIATPIHQLSLGSSPRLSRSQAQSGCQLSVEV